MRTSARVREADRKAMHAARGFAVLGSALARDEDTPPLRANARFQCTYLRVLTIPT